jgi:hypothetical protein
MALTCAQCGTENPDDAYFCSKCGAQVWTPGVAPAAPAWGQEPPAMEPPAAVTFPPPPPSANRIAPPPPGAPADPSAFLVDNAPVAPAPPPSTYTPPQDYGQYQQAAPPAQPYAGYGYAPPPPDGNTSGMGTAYPAPAFTQGWTFAGCVPWGLFAFMNGNSTMGAIGLVAQFFGLHLVYAIYMGIKGRELAWQGRRFDSVGQYDDTMKAWNKWGIIVTVVLGILLALYFVGVFVFAFWAASQPGAMNSPSTTTPPPASSSSADVSSS